MATDERKDTAQTFRAGAGIILRKGTGDILLCQRKDTPYTWSLPQGGIEAGESPIQAAYREMGEELGLTANEAHLVGVYPHLLSYLVPSAYKKAEKLGLGQTIRWFLFDYHQIDTVFKIGSEFQQFKWWPVEALGSPSRLYVSPFKVEMYRQLMIWLQNPRASVKEF